MDDQANFIAIKNKILNLFIENIFISLLKNIHRGVEKNSSKPS